ncbi:KH domain-containing protein [Acutalibacter sp. 1XD8-33]|uniref:KH domain-containing protein n=1 Tax=Acutalibacter sp. 1XD8-33 TaxID=2320081 RepID=UPI000EA33618|nr:KH domain-containing protein [Acutalibacter sp. 1XD8-33]RKJ42221.1 KH domain-containing protein [Acutalibacter sp. 1XD8-33]
MQDLLKAIASGLVEKPEEVSVTSEEGENGVTVYHLHVAEDDMGRVIGKQGRIAKAIRVVMRAAATRNDMKIMVEID